MDISTLNSVQLYVYFHDNIVLLYAHTFHHAAAQLQRRPLEIEYKFIHHHLYLTEFALFINM